MNILELHNKAMEYAELGFLAQKYGFESDALHNLKYALELETKAANSISNNAENEPSRSILYRSAASLAELCSEYKIAEELIKQGISDFTPNELLIEFKELKSKISKIFTYKPNMNMKRQINHILTEMFPFKRAIVVLTRVNFDYLIKTGISLAWSLNPINAKKYSHLIIVGLDDKQRGKYIDANIEEIMTCEEIKQLYNRHKENLSEKLRTFIELEKEISVSTFYKSYLNNDKYEINYEHDRRIVIFFDTDRTSMKVDRLAEEYKGLAMPAFFIPAR
jgi:hypothetical protein